MVTLASLINPPSTGPHTTCHGLVHRKKREGGREAGGPSCVYGVTHTQEKHFQVPKCQWAITVGCLMHRGNMRAQGTDVKKKAGSLPTFLGNTFVEDQRRGKRGRESREGARAWWSITIHSPLTFNSSSLPLPSQNHIFIWNSQQPTIHHSATPLY